MVHIIYYVLLYIIAITKALMFKELYYFLCIPAMYIVHPRILPTIHPSLGLAFTLKTSTSYAIGP